MFLSLSLDFMPLYTYIQSSHRLLTILWPFNGLQWHWKRRLITSHQTSSCHSISTAMWFQSGYLPTGLHLWWLQTPPVKWSSFTTFPAGFPPAQSMGKAEGRLQITPLSRSHPPGSSHPDPATLSPCFVSCLHTLPLLDSSHPLPHRALLACQPSCKLHGTCLITHDPHLMMGMGNVGIAVAKHCSRMKSCFMSTLLNVENTGSNYRHEPKITCN